LLRLGVAHDLFAEGRERKAGELEVLNREWDRDDRNAQQDAGNEVRERQIPAAKHKPENVAAARSESRGTRPIGDGPTEYVAHNTFADPDATEIGANEVFGNLACVHNVPDAQFGDNGPAPNIVFGTAKGECAALI
jgi:hypothetical protein